METNPRAVRFQSIADTERLATHKPAGLKKRIQRNMYSWHRIFGLITVVPVIFWTLSGLSHPFMSHWFKPTIAHEFLAPTPLPKDQLALPLPQVLAQHQVEQFRNFRVIALTGRAYYQVKNVDNSLTYYDTKTGQVLAKGDQRYAESLARYFVDDAKTPVQLSAVTEFSPQYRYVNRLLPVYKVSFDRPDQMDVYVETEQGRLANYNERSRKAFLWVFNNFHNWDWLASISNNTLRYSVMLLFLTIITLSAVSGLVIYGFMWTKFRKPRNAADRVGFLRKYHRQIGLATAFVTFTFAFSGAYHATMKFSPDERIRYVSQPVVKTTDLKASVLDLPLNWEAVQNISLARVDDKLYYQVVTKTEEKGAWSKLQQDKAETMFEKVKKPAAPNVTYYDTQTASVLPEGVFRYAADLAYRFWTMDATGGNAACCEVMEASQQAEAGEAPALLKRDFLTKFDREYGFINKRLPVVKMAFDTPDHLTYYLEPATGRLAAKIVDGDRREGLSFAVLHKYFLLDWAGKNVRDIVTMLAAAGVLTVSLFGLALWIKIK